MFKIKIKRFTSLLHEKILKDTKIRYDHHKYFSQLFTYLIIYYL